MSKLVDLTGQRFGRLVVKALADKGRKNVSAKWECICDCGNTLIVSASSLRTGNTRSCGCLHRDANQSGHNTRHGDCYTRLYTIWRSMRQRCGNPKNMDYKSYGGRGILVCDEWKDYTAFKRWALSNGYADNLSIDRINVDGNYEPGNCRWADAKTQANNRRPRRKTKEE